MLSALGCSAAFLTSYLIYHLGYAGRTEFKDPLWFRPYYLTVLYSHLILAMVIVPMIIVTASRALRARFDRHKRIARWTWPLWIYVSITGVIIYLLLYHIFPQGRQRGPGAVPQRISSVLSVILVEGGDHKNATAIGQSGFA